jgi:hypothetical protein
MIPIDKKVTVPAQVLQDLIWNAELVTASSGHPSIPHQCRALQACIDGKELIFAKGKKPLVVETEDNVTFADFRRGETS